MILTPIELRYFDLVRRSRIEVLPGDTYRARLWLDNEPVSLHTSQAQADDVLQAMAALPDDGSGDEVGDPDDEGDEYPRKAVR